MLTVEQLKELKVGDWVWLVQRQDKMPDICAYVEIVPISDNKYLRVGVDGHIVHIPIEKYGTKWVAYRNKEEADETSTILPCKVGDTLYFVYAAEQKTPIPFIVKSITLTTHNGELYFYVSDKCGLIARYGNPDGYIGKDKNIAEERLKEMKRQANERL